MAMGCIDCHDYMDGYNCGKREGTLEELEDMKTKIQNLFTTSVCGDTPYYNAIMVDEILNKRISELKEQANKAALLDIEGACDLTDDNIKKYVYTKEDMINKLKKLKTEIEKSRDILQDAKNDFSSSVKIGNTNDLIIIDRFISDLEKE